MLVYKCILYFLYKHFLCSFEWTPLEFWAIAVNVGQTSNLAKRSKTITNYLLAIIIITINVYQIDNSNKLSFH